MPDYGSKIADKAIDQTARKIRDVYKDAWFDVKAKMDAFQKRHLAKGKEMFNKLVNGEITQAEYHSWMRGQVFIGKQWQDKLDQISKVMDNANKEAMSIVRHGTFNVFAENYNFEAYKLEKWAKGVVSFNIYNEESVARLLKKNPKMLPEWKIHERKDYAWNRQKVENCITQGIIQGEGIEQITDRLSDALITQNENRMRTFARTGMTGAQNAGRQASMEDAEDMGIKVKKRWLATLDSRTRDTHQELDGQEVPVDEPFEVDGMEIMYPGDPNAEPELVYNCRCTMIEVYEGIDRKSVRRAYDDDENGERDTANSYLVEDMTYNEWKEWKENGKQPITESKQEPISSNNEEIKNNTTRVEQQKNELDSDDAKIESIKEYAGIDDKEADEVAEALFGYGSDPEHCFFDGADTEIRERSTPEASKRADAIQKYIDASPKAEGTIYRGMAMSQGEIDSLQVGAEFVDKGSVSSWTTREDVGQRFATQGHHRTGGERVVFQYADPKHGTPVAHLSPTPIEQEVLVNNKYAKYRIVGKETYEKTRKSGESVRFTRILLEEID